MGRPGVAAAKVAPIGSPRLRAVEFGIARSVEVLAALIVLVETLVLFAGVVSRLMRRPLTWSDEFASILFLWLAMLGAVIALYRGEHMRLTTFVAWSPAPLRRLLDALAWVVPMVFLAWMLPYAIEQTLSDWVVSTCLLYTSDAADE